MEQQYTAEKVIGMTAEILRGIKVPAEEAESIGIPIMIAIRNLKTVLDAVEKAETEKPAEETEQAEGGT